MSDRTTDLRALAYYAWLVDAGYLVDAGRHGWRDETVASNMNTPERPSDASPLYHLDDRLLDLL